MTVFMRGIAWIITFGCFIAGVFTGTNNSDFISNYKKEVASVEAYENNFDSAVPQTYVYELIKNHLSAQPKDGKEKKAIVIGYDGCRADNLTMCKAPEESGINTLLADGGQAVISYCGGVNYPYINTQYTSTAPGWCSMLTGVWAKDHGITDNGIVKSNDHLTLLTTLVEDKTIDSSSFCVSWGGHFSADDSTYRLEKQYAEDKKLNVSFLKADNDEGTYENVMSGLNQKDCPDFIFSIFEYCDHTGHDNGGFCKNNPNMVKAFADSEITSAKIIKAIKSRANYANEDWLIIITSDHGGYNTWHGGPTMQERYTPLVANKKFDFNK
ncbi:MAG: alkaline phosphatase family protein [Clostridia bacterium]|nr:alkaline phosphatase family protein [Clostridia bacterium]